MILFLRFRRATLLLTRGMSRSLRHQQALEAAFVGVRDERRFAQVSLPLRMLLGQNVALVRVMTPQPAGPRQADAFAQGALALLLRHSCILSSRGPYFGARTIDMLRPSSFEIGRASCRERV